MINNTIKNKWKKHSTLQRNTGRPITLQGFREFTGKEVVRRDYPITVENPSNSSSEIKLIKNKKDVDIIFGLNKPRGNELREIMDTTMEFIRPLSRAEVYKAMKA